MIINIDDNNIIKNMIIGNESIKIKDNNNKTIEIKKKNL